MRHRNLVFATLLAIFVSFLAVTAEGQKIRPDEEVAPNVVGKVEDLAGRSIRHAQITLYCLDSDEFVSATSNSFGFYRISGLKEGHTYMVAGVEHKRYLFLILPLEITVGGEPRELNFVGEFAR